jgi:hypothetical protein
MECWEGAAFHFTHGQEQGMVSRNDVSMFASLYPGIPKTPPREVPRPYMLLLRCRYISISAVPAAAAIWCTALARLDWLA